MKRDRVSKAVIRRLPRYYRYLNDLKKAGVERISSGALAEKLRLTASQIRQDLSCFGEFGQQGYGYNIEKLLGEVADILGMNHGHSAILLGVGNLGRALLRNFSFGGNGFMLTAAFDVEPALVGEKVCGVRVYHMDELEEYLKKNPTSVGVLTLPGEHAATAAGRLAAAGVRGIWNFTNIEIHPPRDVVVENVHFADSLLALSYMIAE